MAIIGAFQNTEDGGYAGAIRTPVLDIGKVQFRPVEKEHERSPDHRIFAGQAEFGAAWKKTSRDGRDYFSVRLDDPTFPGPIYASLVEAEEGHVLIWSQSRSAG